MRRGYGARARAHTQNIFEKIQLSWLVTLGAVVALVLMFALPAEQSTLNITPTLPEAPLPAELPASEEIEVYNAQEERMQTMSLEEYIVGVTAAEMPASYEAEALKAGAIAARTFATHRILGSGCDEYGGDVCTSSAHCQAYRDEESLRERWGEDFDFYMDKITRAVADTAGIVITYEGEPIDAMYHAVSGGMTENSENVYPNEVPYLKSVQSPGEEDASGYDDVVEVKTSQAVRLLNEFVGENVLTQDNIEREFAVLNRYSSDRVGEVSVADHTIRGKDVRGIFDLNSTNFTIEFSGDSVIFTTVGFGHGVGMSQAGANAMASLGSTYEQILTHYYTGVELTQLFPSPVQ